MSYTKQYEKAGKPITHLPVIDTTTGKVFNTYTEAAADVNGDRTCVMRCCIGVQRNHKGHTFAYYDAYIAE